MPRRASRSSISRSRLAARVALPLAPVVLAGCGGGRPTPAPAPSTPPESSAPAGRPGARTPALPGGADRVPERGAAPGSAGAAATRWRFTRTPGAQVADVRVETDVERLGPDGRRADGERIETSAIVSLVVARGATGENVVTGRVDSLLVRAAPRVRAEARPVTGGVRVRGALDARGGARLELEPGGDARCATPGGAEAIAALALARETLPRVPATLAVGARWRDTTAVTICAGTVPVRAQVVTAYEVLPSTDDAPSPGEADVLARAGAESASVVRVRRQTTATLRGQGFAAGRFAGVTGSSTGEGRLLLDAARGRLLHLDDAVQATLALTLAGDAPQRFAQRARTQVLVRP